MNAGRPAAALVSILALLASGCGSSLRQLDCSGLGEVTGQFEDINDGSLRFRHGLAWERGGGAHGVVFTENPLLVEALLASPDPDWELVRAGELLGELLVGAYFAADGRHAERFSAGTRSSRGWSSDYDGSFEVDEQGCARGYVQWDGDNGGRFALPLVRPALNRSLLAEGVEAGAAPAAATPPVEDRPLPRWRDAHRRLQAAHPADALQALGLSAPAAERLAKDAKALALLQRVRTQCPHPDASRLNEYEEVVGIAEPTPGVRLAATVQTYLSDQGAALESCYVMRRNGQDIEQCWVLREDCTRKPLWTGSE